MLAFILYCLDQRPECGKKPLWSKIMRYVILFIPVLLIFLFIGFCFWLI